MSCHYNSDCSGSGQVCLAGACACACKADVDCGRDEKCDGCACVGALDPIAGIVTGDVNIVSSLQLPAYRGTTEIIGDLSISGTSIADFGDAFASLRRVQGAIEYSFNEQLSDFAAFPALEEAQTISFHDSSLLSTISLPALKSASISLRVLPGLTHISVPAWQTGAVDIYQLGSLTELDCPSLASAGEVQIIGAPLLKSIQFPLLARLGDSLWFDNSGTVSALDTLNVSRLAALGEDSSSGALSISDTKLTSLDLSALTHVELGLLQISRNPLLSECVVADLVSRFSGAGFDGAPIIDFNAACALCAGSVCAE